MAMAEYPPNSLLLDIGLLSKEIFQTSLPPKVLMYVSADIDIIKPSGGRSVVAAAATGPAPSSSKESLAAAGADVDVDSALPSKSVTVLKGSGSDAKSASAPPPMKSLAVVKDSAPPEKSAAVVKRTIFAPPKKSVIQVLLVGPSSKSVVKSAGAGAGDEWAESAPAPPTKSVAVVKRTITAPPKKSVIQLLSTGTSLKSVVKGAGADAEWAESAPPTKSVAVVKEKETGYDVVQQRSKSVVDEPDSGVAAAKPLDILRHKAPAPDTVIASNVEADNARRLAEAEALAIRHLNNQETERSLNQWKQELELKKKEQQKTRARNAEYLRAAQFKLEALNKRYLTLVQGLSLQSTLIAEQQERVKFHQLNIEEPAACASDNLPSLVVEAMTGIHQQVSSSRRDDEVGDSVGVVAKANVTPTRSMFKWTRPAISKEKAEDNDPMTPDAFNQVLSSIREEQLS